MPPPQAASSPPAIERNGVSIAEAAFLAGYSSPANFSTAFRKAFGLSPGASRHPGCHPSHQGRE
ncbi:helix-turn-helix domain-containing protein [Faunimonas pinastri]|uniref:helix-turn-helix domain-containing protein n=1 Tax=Faunimonas pinastri TaxID=1855383 RepID=UPI000B812488